MLYYRTFEIKDEEKTKRRERIMRIPDHDIDKPPNNEYCILLIKYK